MDFHVSSARQASSPTFFLRTWGIALCLALSALWIGAVPTFGDPIKIEVKMADGAVIRGTLSLEGGEGKRPLVLLMHQAQRSRAEFDFLLADLHGLGFHTLAIDLRGHGESTKPETIDRAFFMKLFRDPDFAPPDVAAILSWAAAHERVDAERMAAMGGSVGANLSYVATGTERPVKTAVSLSGNADAVADLSSKVEGFSPRNVLILAADDDNGRDAYAERLFAQAAEPKLMEIVAGSSAHGTDLLRENPAMKQKVLDWLAEQLGS